MEVGGQQPATAGVPPRAVIGFSRSFGFATQVAVDHRRLPWNLGAHIALRKELH
jgi:hypothetical protein